MLGIGDNARKDCKFEFQFRIEKLEECAGGIRIASVNGNT
jgi:hypothetical protein